MAAPNLTGSRPLSAPSAELLRDLRASADSARAALDDANRNFMRAREAELEAEAALRLEARRSHGVRRETTRAVARAKRERIEAAKKRDVLAVIASGRSENVRLAEAAGRERGLDPDLEPGEADLADAIFDEHTDAPAHMGKRDAEGLLAKMTRRLAGDPEPADPEAELPKLPRNAERELAKLREDLERNAEAIAQVERAPLPLALVHERLETARGYWRRNLASSVSSFFHGDSAPAQVEPPRCYRDPAELALVLDDLVGDRLARMAEEHAAKLEGEPMDPETRLEALDTLYSRTLEVERAEERLIRAMHAHGLEVERRSDADGAVLLDLMTTEVE